MALRVFYEAVIRSIMCYGSPVFCNAPATLFAKILRLEKRFIKIFNIKPKVTINDHIEASHLRLRDAIEGNAEHPLRQLLVARSRRYPTRRLSTLNVPQIKTERHKKIIYSGFYLII